MALTFTTPIELASGISVENAYGRVAAVDQSTGTRIDALVDIFTSEQAFLDGKESLQVSFNRTASMEYNRETMGVDVLSLGHDALVYTLGQQGIVATKNL